MKKIAVIAFLLAVSVAMGRAQESRQDVSISGSVLIPPFIASSTNVQVDSKRGLGVLASYRYMLAPTTAIEANYGITYQNVFRYRSPNFPAGINVPARVQEVSGAVVRSFVFKNWNPFAEAGPGGFIMVPIVNSGLQTEDVRQQTEIGFIYGAGVAYEISPSFDIRAEYRGLVMKVPTFNETFHNFGTNKWFNIFDPTLGVAYHF
jgi:outer membrane immunogenic protein